jgi:hypothetical protein
MMSASQQQQTAMATALEIKYKIRSLVTWELDPLTVTTMTEAGGESLVGLDFNYSMEREHGQHSS